MTGPDESQLAHCRDCAHRLGSGCGCECCTWAGKAVDAGHRAALDAVRAQPGLTDSPDFLVVVIREAVQAALPVVRVAAVAAERERLAGVLREHYLANVACDHAQARDQPWCACSLVDLGWHPSVGAAVDAWIGHVADLLRGHRWLTAAGGPAPTTRRAPTPASSTTSTTPKTWSRAAAPKAVTAARTGNATSPISPKETGPATTTNPSPGRTASPTTRACTAGVPARNTSRQETPMAHDLIAFTTDGDTLWLACFADDPDAERGQIIGLAEPGTKWADLAPKVAEHIAQHGRATTTEGDPS